jgi:hypothetical protein
VAEDYECKQGDRCVCGGDTPRVRAQCIQYIDKTSTLAVLFPEMPKHEYEWLCCTVLSDGQSQTLYRHRMSRRMVLVCKNKDQLTTIWLSDAVSKFIKDHYK